MLKCLVIDDEPLAVRLLENYIEKTDFLECKFSTTNPVEGLKKTALENFDLIFLDIQMPELNGIDFLKILGDRAKVILTTAYSEFALESYDYGVVDYLLKPISYSRFLKSVDKVQHGTSEKLENVTRPDRDFFFVKSGGKQIKINFDDILFVESLRDYVNIRTAEEELIVLENLKSLEENLPENFMRVHRSYIVNLRKVSEFGSAGVSIAGRHFPVGERYRAAFLSWLKAVGIRPGRQE